MKKVCISTFCYWSNYGSVFQALGLKRVLGKMGIFSSIVQDEPKDKVAPKNRFPSLKALLSKQGVRHLHAYLIRNKTNRFYQFSQKFIDEHLDFLYFDNYETLKNHPPKADAYLAGSDQIWNPRRCLPACFLDWVPCNAPKLSYAASMGVADLPDENRDIFVRYIRNFDALSVREKDNAQLIETVTGLKSEVHIDPSFLLTADEWRAYEEKRNLKGPFILVYALYWNRKCNKDLRRLKKETGCRVIVVSSTLRPIFADETLYDVTPSEFLYLIDHADYVVTSSFHGAALSILFNKQFATVVNPSKPSRIMHLLDVFSMKKRDIADLLKKPIDYLRINERIAFERNRSIAYLKDILHV